MKNFLLIHSSQDLPYINHFEEDKIIKIDFEQNNILIENLNKYSKAVISKSHELNIYNIIIELNFDKLTIQDNDRYNTAILLATVLRLDSFFGNIFLIGSKDFTTKNRLAITTKSYELLEEIRVATYLTIQEAFQPAIKEIFSFRIQEIPLNPFDFSKFITEFTPTPSKDRHQVTNEWGALKLALNAGHNQKDINFKFPESLFFKFLQKKIGTSLLNDNKPNELISTIKKELEEGLTRTIELTPIDVNDKINFFDLLKHKKILLIDDNADKGWKAIISKLFEGAEVDSQTYMMGVAKKNSKGKWEIENKIDRYDIVFLDLYMPESGGKKPELNNGKELLRLIKEKYPQIPVIIFTASNKSWTLDEVLELGADGMYVKESPEYVDDKQYSEGNFRSFIKTVWSTLSRYKTLRPYWEAIQEILKSQVFQNIPEKRFKSKTTKFKERIEERLKMFYGLLKRGFEQRGYNQRQFYFSDYELAFMTLWSVLNEISEAYYDKEDKENKFKLRDKNGKDWECNPIPNHKDSNWKIINTSEYLIKHEYEFENFLEDGTPLINYRKPNLKSKKVEVSIKSKYDSYKEIINDRKEVTKEIGPQIGFIIRKYHNINEDNRDIYCKNLHRLNKVRNDLYLTHGDYVSSGFFSQTEQEKRTEDYNITPKGDIEDLFEILFFLLTGETKKVFD